MGVQPRSISRRAVVIQLAVVVSVDHLFQEYVTSSVHLFPKGSSVFQPSLPVMSISVSAVIVLQ